MTLPVLAAAGAVPIVVVFLLMAWLRWPAARAMGVGWVLASGLGLLLWRMETGWWTAAAVYGALQALEIVLIVFGAILLMNHLDRSGAIDSIRGHLTGLVEDRRIQLLLVGMGFITLLEGVAGFGTPGALAAPLLIGLGFPALAAVTFGLMFNAPQPPFGAAGTPVIGGVGAVIDEEVLSEGASVAEFLGDVSAWTAAVTAPSLVFWGLIAVFLLVFWFGDEEEHTFRAAAGRVAPVAPFALLLGVLTGGIQLAVAWLFGPELPDIAAGFVALSVGIVLARRGILTPDTAWDFPEQSGWPEAWRVRGEDRADEGEDNPDGSTEGAAAEHGTMPVWLAWTPYLLVALVLLVTRWPGLGMVDRLRGYSFDIERILGQNLSFSLEYLYLPGIVPFIPVAILTGLLHRMDLSSIGDAWGESFRQILSPALTLVVAVSMTQVMIQSATNLAGRPGMMEALSGAVAMSAGNGLPFFSPWLGAVGAFVTGSSTSSNVLFSVLQHDAAMELGLDAALIVGLQNAGSGVGNMVSVLNIAAIAGVVGMTGREGRILRRMLIPTALLGLFAGLWGLALARAAVL